MSTSNYINVYYDTVDGSLKGKLKPICCKSCQDNGERCGSCPTCLENQAYNREYMETHSFITDTNYQCYHYHGHDDIKSIPLRLPNEHPYLYYGIELEVEFDSGEVSVLDNDDDYYDEDDRETSSDMERILERFSEITDGLFVYERDGSLDNGVEMISRPCSYAYWTSEDTVKKLKEGLEYLVDNGAYVDQPTSNGMHIHISRKFFDNGNTHLACRGEAYKSFDWIFQKFQPEFEKLGGRKYTHFCESKADKLAKNLKEDARFRYSSYGVDIEMKATLKKGGEVGCDHYCSVNLGGRTIETRIFKSTTDYKQVLANIEIVRNIAHAVREENIEKSLDDLLHTKDNLYLDDLIRKTRQQCAKNHEEFDLNKMNDNKLEVNIQ